jgi:hypothetical protein
VTPFAHTLDQNINYEDVTPFAVRFLAVAAVWMSVDLTSFDLPILFKDK